MAIVTRQIQIDTAKAFKVGAEIVQMIVGKEDPEDKRQGEAECALLIAYADIALGCREFPLVSREVRQQLVVARAMRALCAVIEEVGKLSEAEVTVEASGTGRAVN